MIFFFLQKQNTKIVMDKIKHKNKNKPKKLTMHGFPPMKS